jgi:hypothetical protein
MFASFKTRETPVLGSYTAAQAAGAQDAVDLVEAGDLKGAGKLLNRHGMKLADARAHVASLNITPDAAEAPAAQTHVPAAPTATSPAERITVKTPYGYNDSVEQRAKLIAALWGMAGSGWQVESFDQQASTVVAVRGELPSWRPVSEVFDAPNATVGNGEAISASHAAYGRTMLGYDPYKRQAETAVLPPATIELRNRLLRKNPKQKSWELEILPIFGVRDGEGFLSNVIITRADQHSPDRDKEFGYWLGLAKNTIGHSGWWVDVDDINGTVQMNAGTPISIPSKVSYDYDVIENGEWGELVVGRDGYNKPVIVDLAATPHVLVVGRTGSGKSIFLQTVVYSAIVHGFELAILDPTKRGLDFRWARPYVRDGGWGCQSFPEALEAIKTVYTEAQRRLDILDELSVPKWSALSKADQIKYGIKPILIVIDEGTSMAKLLSLPKTMDKDDPEFIEMSELNAAKERILMYVGKILRECRFVGIHLVFGTQRFGVGEIGQGAGEMRENMAARIVLGRSSTTSLAMACADPQDAAAAYEQAHGLAAGENDPSVTEREATPGRGLAEIDGRGHVALQGAFAPVDELIARLTSLGVPSHSGDRRPVVPEKDDGLFAKPAARFPAAAKPIVAEPVVVEHDALELSLDDLDKDAPAAPDAEVPVWAAAAETVPEETDDAQEAEWAATPVTAAEPAAAPFDDEEDPFAEEATPVRTPRIIAPAEEDPFATPAKKKAAAPVADAWWD